MKKSIDQRNFQRSIGTAAAICFALTFGVISALGQIPIGGGRTIDLKKPVIKRPEVKSPANPNESTGTANPSSNTGNAGGSTSARTDPPASLVNAFKADAGPYKQGILQ